MGSVSVTGTQTLTRQSEMQYVCDSETCSLTHIKLDKMSEIVRDDCTKMATTQRHNMKCIAKKSEALHASKGRQAGTHGTMHLAVYTVKSGCSQVWRRHLANTVRIGLKETPCNPKFKLP